MSEQDRQFVMGAHQANLVELAANRLVVPVSFHSDGSLMLPPAEPARVGGSAGSGQVTPLAAQW